jgi:arsenite methyltransferase
MEKEKIKKIVKDAYKDIASKGSGCGCSCKKAGDISRSIGYTDEELKIVGKANLGLGCGNPLAFGRIKEGDVVLDLGSGAGIDAILAAKKVGSKGKVIGVDITKEMIELARKNAAE